MQVAWETQFQMQMQINGEFFIFILRIQTNEKKSSGFLLTAVTAYNEQQTATTIAESHQDFMNALLCMHTQNE